MSEKQTKPRRKEKKKSALLLAIRYRLEYFVVRMFICVVQALPLRRCWDLADWLGYLFFDVLKVRKRITMENIRAAFPGHTEETYNRLAKQMWQHLFLMVIEIAIVPRKLHYNTWRKHLQLANMVDTVKLMLEDRPVVIITAHFGNFELCNYAMGLLGYQTYSVARTLDNPLLNKFLLEFRAGTGQDVIPKKDSYEQIVGVLQEGATVAFLADQYAGKRGCPVTFFGRETSGHKAIPLFSLQQDAPMVIGYSIRTGGPLEYEIAISEIADPRDNHSEIQSPLSATQWYTSAIERFVRRSPHQYWWLHNRWRPPYRRGQKRKMESKAKNKAA
ncbi:Lipid A biosynthesis lauroyl acyltransferase [Planctomycetales bacterium 10988]|nr:Lipid A biosynthesis lauroyl acyltransferase [Planctomycetales bacterium 10988]